MKRTCLFLTILLCLLSPGSSSAGGGAAGNPLVVLCWHAVQKTVAPGDDYSISREAFIEQLEYLKGHDYHPVSVQQVIDAAAGRSALPEKPVLLSFDDAYRSFYDFVFPVLSGYGYPSMLAVVGSWIENRPPKELPEPLMTWEQIASVLGSKRVEIASHTYDLHRSIRYNPQGNVAAMISVRQFLAAEKRYETESEYRQKLAADFSSQVDLFERRLGISPRVTVWPYGRRNDIAIGVAREHGSVLAFNLGDGPAQLDRPLRLNRIIVENRPIQDFIGQLTHLKPRPDAIRAMQVDLDLIYDPASEAQTDQNLGLLIDRMVNLGINTVFLQAFNDISGTGNIRRVYFHNRVLPVEADIFSHAAHQIGIRGIAVYAWMPTLSIVFPDEAFNRRFRVREYADGAVRPSHSWYRRLTPFSAAVRQRVRTLYEDLAAGAQIDGILFQDDAYLTDREDMHPLALDAFGDMAGRSVDAAALVSDAQLQARWTEFKTRRLIEYMEDLKAGVRKFRPEARFARNLYANVLMNPGSQTWFAQNYADFVAAYDHVVVMAYPQMEHAKAPLPWLKTLAEKALAVPGAREKNIFKLQAYDWQENSWIDAGLLLREMRTVLAAGVRHVAYYPDNLWDTRPGDTITREMSTRTEPRIR